jgi:predicted Ser/Thr protein kinase
MAVTKKEKQAQEDFEDLKARAERLESLYNLSKLIRARERRQPMTFNDFLHLLSEKPEVALRDVFQMFYDMIHHYVPEGTKDFSRTDDSIGFWWYDFSNLFVTDCDDPFFADRLFAYRFMKLVDGFRKGTQKNNIYLFEGPPGSGKSLFLNGLLQKLEEYTKTEEGATFKAFWCLDVEKLGGFQKLVTQIPDIAEEVIALSSRDEPSRENHAMDYPQRYLEFSCPNHDHPVLMVPKPYRKQFLYEVIHNRFFIDKIFYEKQYEWVLKDIPCNICHSIFKALLDITGEPLEVFNMIRVRKNFFSRQLGEGVSIFNPGDITINKPITNPTLQKLINELFKNDDVRFRFSYLAKTNNGVLALMDIKEHNVQRLKNWHGIISDGVHKVELAEERINTLFLGTLNPSDDIHFKDIPSFQDRIITVKIPYVLDYKTEIEIYKNKYGQKVAAKFLPRVLENFAKIIISTRLDKDSSALKKWIKSTERYSKYLDQDMLLLKMELYSGNVPFWLSEEDVKRLNRRKRKEILDASQSEGYKGISGRHSLIIFNELVTAYSESEKLITMVKLLEFFTQAKDPLIKDIPEGFTESLERMYDYNVLQEVKEALYYYNEEQLAKDIQNYLFAINFEPGVKKKSDFTGDVVEIDEDYFKNFEAMFLGTTSTPEEREEFRKDTHNEYVSKTLYKEMQQDGKKITETEQFEDLFDKYTRSLKENALLPYVDNENFRRAIHDHGTKNFKAYDRRLKRDVELLLTNLHKKFKYTKEGARQIALYVIDKNLLKEY